MISLRRIAADHLALAGAFSVVRDVFGYRFRDSDGRLFYDRPRQLEVGHQLRLCAGPAVNLNLILVGVEDFTVIDLQEVQHAVQFTRDIYDDVDLGVRQIRWCHIPLATAGSYAIIDSRSETQDLTDDWNGPGGAIDVFVVRSITAGFDGRSAIDGPCSKDDKDRMTGSVVSLMGDFANSGNTLAHELAHYLGLDHVLDRNNFIGNDGASNSNTRIEADQGVRMKRHCYVTEPD